LIRQAVKIDVNELKYKQILVLAPSCIHFAPMIRPLSYLFLTTLLLQSCAGSQPLPDASTASRLAPDYHELQMWAAHPWKKDPSDSTPRPYITSRKDTLVDVFFIHPTTYTQEEAVANKPFTLQYWNASVQDEALNNRTDESSILNQASPFNVYRVFAPRYRQAHIQSFSLPDSIARPFFDTAYADVKNAFEYYLEHFNQGRPFIIASHSQGTLHAGRLIKEMIEEKPLQQQLVAAYIIGLAVPVSYFRSFPICDSPDGTGCFVSWRTYKKGYEPKRVLAEKEPSFVVNPISWRTGTEWVSRKEQKGAVLYRFNKPKAKNVGAGIHGNVLWSDKPRFFGNLFFTQKNYHIGDINLFWKDIRDNVDLRVEAFRAKQKSQP
jgi:hypothetical protein